MSTFPGESDYSFINFIDLRDLTLGFIDFSYFLFIKSLNVIAFFCSLWDCLSVSFWLLKMEIEVIDLKPFIFFIYQYKCLMSESLHNHALVESQLFWNFDFIFTPSKMLSNFFIYFLIGYELFLSVLFILQRFGDFPKDLSADYFYFGSIWVRKYTCYDWNPSNS